PMPCGMAGTKRGTGAQPVAGQQGRSDVVESDDDRSVEIDGTGCAIYARFTDKWLYFEPHRQRSERRRGGFVACDLKARFKPRGKPESTSGGPHISGALGSVQRARTGARSTSDSCGHLDIGQHDLEEANTKSVSIKPKPKTSIRTRIYSRTSPIVISVERER